MVKAIVVYYSYEGSTDFVAQNIAKQFKADVLRLKPIEDMKSKGFMKLFWGGRQVLMKKEPKLEKYEFDSNKYDTIFIGTPCWAFTFAPALRTFFSENKIEKKKIVLFCSHGGGPGKTIENMKQEIGDKNDYIEDFLIKEPIKRKEEAKKEIKEWLGRVKVKIEK